MGFNSAFKGLKTPGRVKRQVREYRRPRDGAIRLRKSYDISRYDYA